MRIVKSSALLRRILATDAVFSGLSGVGLTLGAAPFSTLFGLPYELVLGAGLFLVPYALFVAWLGARATAPSALVWLVVVGNAVWTLESIVLVVSGQASPTTLGAAVVIAQAIAVAIIADVQALGLKRSDPLAA